MQNFSLLSQLLGPNGACTKFGFIKCKIDPIFRLWAPEKVTAANAHLHHPLLVAVLKKQTQHKSVNF